MLPSISIVTPSFNQGRFIERTIQSVLTQNIPGLEYMIIDGGSHDETVSILKKYNDRIKWISEKDKGQADAVNKGIRMTKGEIIGWLNSDDIYYPEALSAVVKFFNENPEIDIIYGDADHIDLYDNVIEPYYTENWDYERLKDICFICQPAVFFRRRLTEKYGLLDESLQYCMDYEYWLRIGKHVPLFRFNKRLAGSRMYDENKTLGSRVAVHKEMNDMLLKRLGMVPAKWIFAYAHVVVNHKKYDRSSPAGNLKYVIILILMVFRSFIYWKQGIRSDSIKIMISWFAGALKNYIA